MLSDSLVDSLRSVGLLPFVEIQPTHEKQSVSSNALNSENSSNASSTFIRIAIYENEIKRPLRKIPYGSALIEYLLPPLDRARFTNDDGTETVKSLSHVKPLIGYEWKENDWTVEINTTSKDKDLTDKDGYQYAHGWYLLNQRCHLQVSDSFLMNVRRRKWVRTLVLKSEELASYGQLSSSNTFIPYELFLTIKRAYLQGSTSQTFAEVYVDGKLIDKTSNGPSEWNKLMVIPFYSLPDVKSTKISCVVKSDAFLNKFHPDFRLKGEAFIEVKDILDTLTKFTRGSISMSSERVYPFMETSSNEKLVVGINFVEHRLFRVEVDRLSSAIYDNSLMNTSLDDREEMGSLKVPTVSILDRLSITKKYTRNQFVLTMDKIIRNSISAEAIERFPKILYHLKELVESTNVSDQCLVMDLCLDIVDLINKQLDNLLYYYNNNNNSNNNDKSRSSSSSSTPSPPPPPPPHIYLSYSTMIGIHHLSLHRQYRAMSIPDESILSMNPVLTNRLVTIADSLVLDNHEIFQKSLKPALSLNHHRLSTTTKSVGYILTLYISEAVNGDEQQSNSLGKQISFQLKSEKELILLLRAMSMVNNGKVDAQYDQNESLYFCQNIFMVVFDHSIATNQDVQPTTSQEIDFSKAMNVDLEVSYDPELLWIISCTQASSTQRSSYRITVDFSNCIIPFAKIAGVEVNHVMGGICSHILEIEINSVHGFDIKGVPYNIAVADTLHHNYGHNHHHHHHSHRDHHSMTDSIESINRKVLYDPAKGFCVQSSSEPIRIPVDLDFLTYCDQNNKPEAIPVLLQIQSSASTATTSTTTSSSSGSFFYHGISSLEAADIIAATESSMTISKNIIECNDKIEFQIEILSANNLIGVDVSGTSDPYVIVYLVNALGEPISMNFPQINSNNNSINTEPASYSKLNMFSIHRKPKRMSFHPSYTNRSEYNLPDDCIMYMTNTQSRTCNPIWSKAIVSLKPSMLSRGRYIMLEIWDANNLTAHTCLGYSKLSIDFNTLLAHNQSILSISTHAVDVDKYPREEMNLSIHPNDKIPKKFLHHSSYGSLLLNTKWILPSDTNLSPSSSQSNLENSSILAKSTGSFKNMKRIDLNIVCRPMSVGEALWPCYFLFDSINHTSSSNLNPNHIHYKSMFFDPIDFTSLTIHIPESNHHLNSNSSNSNNSSGGNSNNNNNNDHNINIVGIQTNNSSTLGDDSILKECIEYVSCGSIGKKGTGVGIGYSLKIPWNQINSESIVQLSPLNAIYCDVTLNRKFATGDIRQISYALVIGPCPAEDLKYLILDRINVMTLRPLIDSKAIPSVIKAESIRTILNPFIEKFKLIEQELQHIARNTNSFTFYSASNVIANSLRNSYLYQIRSLQRLKTRIHLYCSYVIDITFLLVSNHSDHITSILSSTSTSAQYSSNYESSLRIGTSEYKQKGYTSESDEAIALLSDRSQVLSIFDILHKFAIGLQTDVWNISLERRYTSPESLGPQLTYFIHQTYLRLIYQLKQLIEDYVPLVQSHGRSHSSSSGSIDESTGLSSSSSSSSSPSSSSAAAVAASAAILTSTSIATPMRIAESKRQLLHAIVANDNLFMENLNPILTAFELKFSRNPLLTHSLRFGDIQRKLYELLTDEINVFLTNSLINVRLNAYRESIQHRKATMVGNNTVMTCTNSVDTNMMNADSTRSDRVSTKHNSGNNSNNMIFFSCPWTLERDGGEYTKVCSRIPEDTMFQMNLQISSRIIYPLIEWSDKNISVIQSYNFKVASAVAEAYAKLAVDYTDGIQQCCHDADKAIASIQSLDNRATIDQYVNPADIESRINEIEDRVIEFLISIVNDTDRILYKHIPTCKKFLARRSNGKDTTNSMNESDTIEDDTVSENDNGDIEEQSNSGISNYNGSTNNMNCNSSLGHSYRKGIPLIKGDINIIFEKAVNDIRSLARYAISRVNGRFYSSLDHLFFVDIEENVLRATHPHTMPSSTNYIRSMLSFDGNDPTFNGGMGENHSGNTSNSNYSSSNTDKDRRIGISDLCGTIVEFIKSVKVDLLLPKYHSMFIRDIFNRLCIRYLVLVIGLKIAHEGNSKGNHVVNTEHIPNSLDEIKMTYRPGVFIRKLIALPVKGIETVGMGITHAARSSIALISYSHGNSLTNSQSNSDKPTSTADDCNTSDFSIPIAESSVDVSSYSPPSSSLNSTLNSSSSLSSTTMPMELINQLLKDVQVINTCFGIVMNFNSIDPTEQMKLVEEYNIRLFTRFVQQACFDSDDVKYLDSKGIETQIQKIYNKTVPNLLTKSVYLLDNYSKLNKLREFLIDQWIVEENETKTNKNVLSYNLEVSNLECFNIRLPFNSFVKVSVGAKNYRSSAQFYTTKPVFPETFNFQMEVVEKDLLILELMNFRPLLGVFRDFVVARVVISLSGLVVDEPYISWYRLSPPSNIQTLTDALVQGQGYPSPTRDIPNIQMQARLKLTATSKPK